MLDIGIITPELTKYGGAERFLIECVVRWQKKHKITLYSTGFEKSILREHGVDKDVKLVRLSPYFEGSHSMFLNVGLLPKVWECEIGTHDVYQTNLCPTHLIDIHPSVWCPHEPSRMIYDLKYDQPYSPDQKNKIHIYPKRTYDQVEGDMLEPYIKASAFMDKLITADTVIANSRYSAAYLERVYDRKVSDVVYPGVNPDDFLHMAPDENILLTVGQLWPHKRIKLIIEAIRSIDDVQLYVVGSGPEKDRLKDVAYRMGVSDRVFFLEGLTNHEVQILFARSLAVVFTPIREPFGIVALEAMAAGRPLIGVNEGGFTEVVDPSCSFLVPPSPFAIAEKVRYLIDNKDVAKEMGAAGLERARKYTWDRTADTFLSVIERTHREWNKKNKKKKAPSVEERKRTLFGAHYYCWYGDGLGASHWNDNPEKGAVTDMPIIGYYASSYGATIESHLDVMEKAGMDFIILSIHLDNDGFNEYELASIKNILSIAKEKNSPLKFTINLCLYDFQEKDLEKLMDTINRNFVSSEHYLRLNNKPVIYIFWTGYLDGSKKHVELLEKNCNGFIKVANSLRLKEKDENEKTFGLFDGYCLYSPLELIAEKNWEKLWQQAYETNVKDDEVRVITVSPGYDDSHLKDDEREDNTYRVVERNNGKTYKRMIDFALSQKTPPHMAVLTSFNEYHENTHIEPSVDNGTLYMDMTKDFILKGKKKWDGR